MDKTPHHNSQNIVLALIAVTGFSVASQSGLAGQLFQMLGNNVIQSASAHTIESSPEVDTASLNHLKMEKINADTIKIEGTQAYQINDKGIRTPLEDGYYMFSGGDILTLERGIITNRQRAADDCMINCPFDEAGWRDGWLWERDTSGDDEERSNPLNQQTSPGVRDTFEQIQPRPRVPSGNSTPINPSSPLNPQIQRDPNQTPSRNITPNFGR
ncbi:hypothetical protein Cyast_0760 [Cyanobacterium stanieri PCC 7202]|uniref:Uncharacterized protein n=1 Tax=Cyanobacterium stanieri (strain ATCC 29140 / PCC 7202) TaxID=292563 RepID=K9YJU3_CYASC|nr:hypothetical protein Cyast_0760 [Cyanobacterium stanieri PCC 7202]